MLGIRKRLQSVVFRFPNEIADFIGSQNPECQMGFLQNWLLFKFRAVSSSTLVTSTKREYVRKVAKDEEKARSFTVSYLVDSCGFPLEIAERVSKKVAFRDPKKPNEVLRVLREYGFTNEQIFRVVRSCPFVLLARPEKTLLPKFEFLRSVGTSDSDISKIVCKILWRSLDNVIVPCSEILRSVLSSNEKVVAVLKNMFTRDLGLVPKNLEANISILRRVGMPHSLIESLIIFRPGIAVLKPDVFSYRVDKTIARGFDPSKFLFIHALDIIYLLDQGKLEPKMELFRKRGLSETQIMSAIRKFPRIMTISEKKITNTLDFIVDKMGWRPVDVILVPSIFCYSLEKRIARRCHVVRVILLKGLIMREAISLSTLLICPENSFLELFVTKYLEEVPQLLGVYRGETSIVDLGLGFDNNHAVEW